MPDTGLWWRLFVGMLIAALPPLLMLAAALLLTDTVLAAANPAIVAIVVVAGAVAWAGIIAIVLSRGLADDLRTLVGLAQRGDEGEAGADAAYRRLAGVLDERNRQVSALATQASEVPIDDHPRAVLVALVSAVRRVMQDPTWRCAVLASQDHGLLPPGIYYGLEDARDPEPLGDLERWASVTGSEQPVRRIEGPWGAFALIEIASSERLRAFLYAPWEGRPEPAPAESDLQALVGQHAGTALEHSLLYAQVRSQADELNRLAAVQADFLRGVTHDLQTPLTSIGALATELRADGRLPDSGRADLDSIAHQAERLRRMVSQLLVASRIEAGVLEPQQEVFAVTPLIERTWTALRADRPFEIVASGAPHLAVADPDRIEQVLWAVLDNAVKYSPDGSPIDVTIQPEDGQLAITVRDQGTGMDEETRKRAFDQFYRSPQARKLAPDGSGVGLYAANGLMRAMGGSIEVDSRLGVGTAITLRVVAEPSTADTE